MTVTIATIAELRAAAQGAVTTADPRITDFSEGESAGAVVEAGVVLADNVTRTNLERWNDAFLATSKGNALDVQIVGIGGPARILDTAAQATIVLTRDGYVGAYNDLVIGSEITGEAPDGSTVTFILTEDMLLSGFASTVSGSATSSELGRHGNVPAETLITFSGLPDGLVLTQPQRAAGGADEELDAAYLARFQLGRAAFPGTAYGLEYGAKLVPGVTFAKAVETEITTDAGVSTLVYLYIGDPDAGSNDELAEDVRAILDGTADVEGWRIAGQEVLVLGSEREELNFVISLRVRPNSGVTHAQVREWWIAYLDTLRPSEILYRSLGETWVTNMAPSAILSVDQVVPLSDKISPTEPQMAIRTNPDGSDVAVLIYEVDDAGTETLIAE